MKVCPLCSQKYADDTLNFCLVDGGGLKLFDDAPPTLAFSAKKTQPEEKIQPPKKSHFWKWFAVVAGFFIISFLGIFVLLAAYGFLVVTQNPPENPSSREVKSKITLDKFNRLQNGMTVAQVNEILGVEGSEMSSSDFGYGKSSVYKWGDTYTYIIIGFVDGKSNSKSHSGLK